MARRAQRSGTQNRWTELRSFTRLIAALLALGAAGGRDTFEYVSFTPPSGWTVARADGGRQYVRNEPSGIGIISLLPSQPFTSTPARVFAELWRAHATKIITGPPPEFTTRQEGDVTLLVGARQVRSQGTTVRVVVTTILRQGRAIGVVGTATGAERQAELAAFQGSLRVEPSAPSAGSAPAETAGARPAATAGDLGFDVPPGYVRQDNGAVVILAPATMGERTPCIYGLAPARPATGNLAADAERALVEVVVPGWRRLDDRHAAMRGTAATGWPYVWYRAAFEGDLGGQRQAVNAMAMVLPAGPRRVHVVWGMGSISRCLLDDPTFEQLFHSLRPGGWTSDGGQALRRALEGTWRFTAGAGLQQLTFTADGRFQRDLGSLAQVGVTERTSATASEGRFTLRDGELVLAPDHRPQQPDRYRVRLYDEWFLGGWKRAVALFDGRATPPLVIPYFRVEASDR